MRCSTAILAAAVLVESVYATAWLGLRSLKPTPTIKRANGPADPAFVTVQDGQFMRNGKPFFYFGTNAYWLQHLSDENLNATLTEIAARNFTVVRTWAFNDVTEIPTSGAWFQMFNPNGTVTINNGTNGLQRLDAIVNMAEEKGLLVQFALTNNWNPHPNDTVPASGLARRQNVPSTNATTSPGRGLLSNDYGGMDAYVRAHNLTNHDQFFSNETLITAFENYLSVLIPRYSNRTNVLAWEIANDARCNSSLPASGNCKTTVVTSWHNRIANTVKQLDPNHTVASGTQGFMCMTSAANPCTKLFFKQAPSPQPSPRAVKRSKVTLTEKGILAERRARFKRTIDDLTRRLEGAEEKRKRDGKARWSYRGRAVEKSTAIIRRQSQGITSAMDGSQGVDSLDIGSIENIGFNTFQLFPDQNVYETPDPNLPALNNTIQTGINWIQQQASAAAILNKPIALTGFGLVSQNNLPNFVPFNSSQPLFPALTPGSTTSSAAPTPTPGTVGVEQGQGAFPDDQLAAIYQEWIQAAISNEVQGILQYQWGQQDLTPPTQATTSAPDNTQAFAPAVPPSPSQNTSPNDGYQAIVPVVQNVLQLGAIRQNLKNIDISSAFP